VSPITVPPHILTSDPDSYAQQAVSVRQPRIVEQVIEANNVDPSAREALLDLVREVRSGTVTSPLKEGRLHPDALETEERVTWEEQIAANEGRPWLDIPWYFAEALFYLKLLAASGYYGADGALGGKKGDDERALRDPFLPQKKRELVGHDGALAMAARIMASVQIMGPEEVLSFLLQSSLWGNRLDLSTFEMDETRRRKALDRRKGSLLVDHTEQSIFALLHSERAQVILDNSGLELICDLLLTDQLLSRVALGGMGPASITLHAKKAPFFVSDATALDTLSTIDALAVDADAAVAAAGFRLQNHLRSGRLVVRDHWFWNSALFFTALPPDLRTELGSGSTIVVKGDANYRRLLEDRKWGIELSLDDLAAYFPAPFVAVRTMKSELVIDVPKEQAQKLFRSDPRWMTNGKRGLIRYCKAGSCSPRGLPRYG
jgi:uncharacterized protein with ATP-grasp and redox domains